MRTKRFISLLISGLLLLSLLASCAAPTPPRMTVNGENTVSPEESEAIPSKKPPVSPENPSVSPTPSKKPDESPLPPPVPTPTPTPEKPKLISSLSILGAGDNLIHGGILKDAREHRGTNEDYNFNFVYERVKKQVSAADLAVINEESIILPKRYLGNKLDKYDNKGGVSFVTPAEMFDTLRYIGFDCIDMANNHALDMGAAGLDWALQSAAKEKDLFTIGAFHDEKDRENIRIFEKNGIKVALLAYTYGTNVSSEAANKIPNIDEFHYLVPYINDEEMLKDLALAEKVADFTAVFVHWGVEEKFEPTSEQRRVAKLLAENGAGIIVGHHPHCIQPIEYIDNGKGDKIVCAYSLGTMASNMARDINMLAGFLSFDVNKYDNGEVKAENVVFTPTVFYYNMDFRESKLIYLSDFTEDMAKTHGVRNYPFGSSKKNEISVKGLYDCLHKYIASEFLPEEYKK